VRIEQKGRIRAGTTYVVDTEVGTVDRKRGRRVPLFDRIEFITTVSEKETGEEIFTRNEAWVFPREEER
jgi:hypothetical protein